MSNPRDMSQILWQYKHILGMQRQNISMVTCGIWQGGTLAHTFWILTPFYLCITPMKYLVTLNQHHLSPLPVLQEHLPFQWSGVFISRMFIYCIHHLSFHQFCQLSCILKWDPVSITNCMVNLLMKTPVQNISALQWELNSSHLEG